MTATDLALTVTQMLRKAKVVGKFVEFYGPGAAALPVVDRATIANMAPGIRRDHGLLPDRRRMRRIICAPPAAARSIVALYENYYRAQGLLGIPKKGDIDYSQELELDLASVVPSVAGPEAPAGPDRTAQAEAGIHGGLHQAGHRKWLWQERRGAGQAVSRSRATGSSRSIRAAAARSPVAPTGGRGGTNPATEREMANNRPTPDPVSGSAPRLTGSIGHGSVLIAAITSCTNTRNPSVMLAAGLLAKKAVERGLTVNPTVKTSLAPGSAWSPII